MADRQTLASERPRCRTLKGDRSEAERESLRGRSRDVRSVGYVDRERQAVTIGGHTGASRPYQRRLATPWRRTWVRFQATMPPARAADPIAGACAGRRCHRGGVGLSSAQLRCSGDDHNDEKPDAETEADIRGLLPAPADLPGDVANRQGHGERDQVHADGLANDRGRGRWWIRRTHDQVREHRHQADDPGSGGYPEAFR